MSQTLSSNQMSTINKASAEQAIGIFDSGVGGLSIAKCIHEMMPNEQLIYVADSKFAPYGNLSPAQIKDRVNTISDKLITQGVKAIVIACNTATVNAIDQLRQRVSIPIIGVEPAIKPAAAKSQTKSVGLLVTQATANNQRFLNLVDLHKNGAQVHIQPCPELADVIEQGQAGSDQSKALLQKYLAPLIDKNIDALVLGCTHYPFVAAQIQQILGESIALIETAKPVTQELIRQLEKRALLRTTTNADKPAVVSYSSAPSLELDRILAKLWTSDAALNSTPLRPSKLL